MKNNRKLFGLIAVAMVAMLAFAACGNKDSGDITSPPGGGGDPSPSFQGTWEHQHLSFTIHLEFSDSNFVILDDTSGTLGYCAKGTFTYNEAAKTITFTTTQWGDGVGGWDPDLSGLPITETVGYEISDSTMELDWPLQPYYHGTWTKLP